MDPRRNSELGIRNYRPPSPSISHLGFGIWDFGLPPTHPLESPKARANGAAESHPNEHRIPVLLDNRKTGEPVAVFDGIDLVPFRTDHEQLDMREFTPTPQKPVKEAAPRDAPSGFLRAGERSANPLSSIQYRVGGPVQSRSFHFMRRSCIQRTARASRRPEKARSQVPYLLLPEVRAVWRTGTCLTV